MISWCHLSRIAPRSLAVLSRQAGHAALAAAIAASASAAPTLATSTSLAPVAGSSTSKRVSPATHSPLISASVLSRLRSASAASGEVFMSMRDSGWGRWRRARPAAGAPSGDAVSKMGCSDSKATLNKSNAARATSLRAVCGVANPRHSWGCDCGLRLAAHPARWRAHPRGLIQRRPKAMATGRRPKVTPSLARWSAVWQRPARQRVASDISPVTTRPRRARCPPPAARAEKRLPPRHRPSRAAPCRAS